MKVTGFLVAVLLASPGRAGDIELGLPVVCTFGTDCWIQQYADHDPSADARDYHCGQQTYDDHDGTDFRVLNTASKVDVVASSEGIVKALRDGVDDRLVKTDADRDQMKSRECGNGVVIDHADGWQTQYCHLRKGSVAIKAGDRITAGAKLGQVGFSGMAAFPHVHLLVRHRGEVHDPFGGKPNGDANCTAAGGNLWNTTAAKALAYRDGDILEAAFYDAPPQLNDLETAKVESGKPQPSWPTIVATLWAINLSAGDRIDVTLQGPAGLVATNMATLDRNKAQYLLFAGRKKPKGGWPSGTYTGSATVTHDGMIRLRREWQAIIH